VAEALAFATLAMAAATLLAFLLVAQFGASFLQAAVDVLLARHLIYQSFRLEKPPWLQVPLSDVQLCSLSSRIIKRSAIPLELSVNNDLPFCINVTSNTTADLGLLPTRGVTCQV